jgi:hypothetical protein
MPAHGWVLSVTVFACVSVEFLPCVCVCVRARVSLVCAHVLRSEYICVLRVWVCVMEKGAHLFAATIHIPIMPVERELSSEPAMDARFGAAHKQRNPPLERYSLHTSNDQSVPLSKVPIPEGRGEGWEGDLRSSGRPLNRIRLGSPHSPSCSLSHSATLFHVISFMAASQRQWAQRYEIHRKSN